jgi:hypothetical protein
MNIARQAASRYEPGYHYDGANNNRDVAIREIELTKEGLVIVTETAPEFSTGTSKYTYRLIIGLKELPRVLACMCLNVPE